MITLGPKIWNALPEKIKSEHHIKSLRNTLIYGLDPNADARCTYTNPFMERAHHGNYNNPNSPIYAKFLSWKVAQGILESIIKTNREGKITIFASQKYSKNVQDRMNSLLLKRKEFK